MSDELDEARANPKKIAMDGVQIEEHALKDHLEAERFDDGATAKTNRRPGMRLFQFRNKGTV